MSHDTHSQLSETKTTSTSFRSAFWFVILLAGLFIAAVNFVNVMGHSEEHGEGHEATATEQTHEMKQEHEAAKPAAEEHGETPAPAAPETH